MQYCQLQTSFSALKKIDPDETKAVAIFQNLILNLKFT